MVQKSINFPPKILENIQIANRIPSLERKIEIQLENVKKYELQANNS